MSFFEWLQKQTERDHMIGDLAQDTVSVHKQPGHFVPVESNSSEDWLDYYYDEGSHVVEAFIRAWEEYSGERLPDLEEIERLRDEEEF